MKCSVWAKSCQATKKLNASSFHSGLAASPCRPSSADSAVRPAAAAQASLVSVPGETDNRANGSDGTIPRHPSWSERLWVAYRPPHLWGRTAAHPPPIGVGYRHLFL